MFVIKLPVDILCFKDAILFLECCSSFIIIVC